MKTKFEGHTPGHPTELGGPVHYVSRPARAEGGAVNWPFAPPKAPPALPVCVHGISAADWCPGCMDDFVIDLGVPPTPAPVECTCGYGKKNWAPEFHSDWCDWRKSAVP